MAEQCSYGAWPSPVSARETAETVWLRSATLADDGAVWWHEIRPGEGGRGHLLRASADGHVTDVLDDRDGVEPGVLLPVAGGAMVAASDRDGRLFLLAPGARPRPLAPPPGREHDHVNALAPGPGGREVWAAGTASRGDATESSLIAVPLDGSGAVRTLLRTPQRISAPRPSPDGSLLAWISGDQLLMPWDEAELRVGRITPAGIEPGRILLGGPAEAVCHPEWASARSLYAVSDRSHWWNLYEVGLDGALRPLCPWPEEFGWPLSECAQPTYGRMPDGRLAVLHGTGTWRLDLLDPADGRLLPLDLPYDRWQPAVHVMGSMVAGIAGGDARPAAVVVVDTADGQHRVLQQPAGAVPAAYLPEGIPEAFTGRDGHEVRAVIYRPRNPGYRPVSGERAPYLIFLPDLPGVQPDRVPDLVTAFFTSRGLGVAVVSGRGSAGYGRGYREQLYGRWGSADVEDCAVVIRGLVSRWHADPARLAVRGAGAGGATALGVLAGTDACAAATVYAPVTDLALPGSAMTRYLRQIAADTTLLRSRSWLERIRRPVLMLHGLDDRTVPPEHTAHLREILDSRHVPHACLTFAGERHVFRTADAITRALEAELSFYGQVFRFQPPATSHLTLDGSRKD